MNQVNRFIYIVAVTCKAILLVLVVLTVPVFSQDEWVRIQAENNEVSFLLPKDYLVKVESGTPQKTVIAGFQNGANFEVGFTRQSDPKSVLRRARVDESRRPDIQAFKFDDIYGKSVVYEIPGHERLILIATKKWYYTLKVVSESENNPELLRFLNSIKINGQTIMASASNDHQDESEVISIRSLKVSPQVKEAQKRKVAKFNRKITYEPMAAFVGCEVDYSLRSALLVSDLQPNLATMSGLGIGSFGDMKIKLNLLASGQVGDIVVYSDADKNLLRSYAGAAAGLKFIPAKNSGNPVDSCETVDIIFGVAPGIVIPR